MQDTVAEVIRGAIFVCGMNPPQLKADVEEALRELPDLRNALYALIKDSDELRSKPQLHWTLARGRGLKPNLLLRAMSHPSRFVCKFAVQLL
jgi:hypothetical protein